MKNCFLFIVALFAIVVVLFPCKESVASWAHTWGGSNDDAGSSVAIDRNGNIYIAGSTNSVGAGNSDVLLLKYDNSGNLLWAKTWGGGSDEQGARVAVDTGGNVYVAGWTNTFTAGWFDAFILKFDSKGSLIWNKTWGGSSFDRAHDISFDNSGNIYVACEAYSYGNACAATVLKFNSNGDFLWSRTWDGSDAGTVYDASYGIEVDSYGNIYLAGASWFYWPEVLHILLLKFDSSGNLLWVRRWGGSGHDVAAWGSKIIRVDNSGNIYLAGGTLFGAGDYDALVLKFDMDGNLIWSKTWGGPGFEFAYALSLGCDGNIYVAGEAGSFGTGKDVFLLKYDSSGNLLSQKIWGDNRDQLARSVVVDGIGNIFLAGSSPDTIGVWQEITGTTGIPAGELTSPSGSVDSPAGVISSPTATVTSPSGVIDIGGGGSDALVLKVSEVPGPAIPTLSEWGLIIFGVVLLGFISWVFIKRRKAVVSVQ
jgi:hypothetical protein